MNSWFSGAWEAAQQEPDPNDPNQNTGEVPYPQGVPQQGPVYTPPPPQPSLQDIASGLLGGVRSAAGSAYDFANSITPGYARDAASQQQGMVPDTTLPYGITPWLEHNVQAPAEDVGRFVGGGPASFGLGMENPGSQDIWGGVAAGAAPTTGMDFALNLGMAPFTEGVKPVEWVTGLPFDDIARAGVGAIRGGAERLALNGLTPPPASFDALGGREAAAVQLRNGPIMGAGNPNIDPFGPLPEPKGGDAAYWLNGELPRSAPTPPADPWRASLEAQGINVDAELAKQFPEPGPRWDTATLGPEPSGLDNFQVGQPVHTETPAVVDNTANEMQQALDNARALEGGGSTPQVSPAERIAQIDQEMQQLHAARVAEDDNAAFNRMWQQEIALQRERDGLAGAADRQGMMAQFDALKRPEGGGSTPIPLSAETGSPSAAAGSPLPSSPEIPPANPPGTGQHLIEQGIANDPGLSQAQKDFLNSPNGQAAAAQRDAALLGQTPNPQVTADAARDTAKNMGLPDGKANAIADAMKRSQEATYAVYSTPQGASRVTAGMEAIAHRIEGAVSGNEPDSFINAILSEKTAMENSLARAGVSKDRIASTVDDHVSDMVTRHYGDNTAKAQDTFQKLAGLEERAKVLAKDFKPWTAVNDALKNTVASVGDFAVLGVNGLVEMAQAGPYMALGTLNRAANTIASVLHHPSLLDYERVTGLPNLIAKEAHGLPFTYSGEGFRTGKDAPTLLGLGGSKNPLSPIDKHVVQPVINANNKLQFDMIQGWAKNSISDGLLTQEYVRKFAEGLIANKGSVRAANDFAMQYVARPDVLRDIARFTRNATSSTTTALAPGRQLIEGMLPFSATFTRAQPARWADMAKLAAPGASETQRVLAASAIFSTAAFMMGAYKFANDKFGTTDAQMDLSKPGAGQIVLPGGQVISMLPQSSLRNAFVQSNEAIKDHRPEDIKGILAQTAIGRLAPLWSDAIKVGTGYGYDTKGNFYSPFKDDGKKMEMDERLKASAPLPFTAGPIIFNGQPVFSTETGLNVAGFNPYNEKASVGAYRERQDAAQVRGQSLVNKDLLQTAFKDNPEMANILIGKEWGALEYEEKQAILNALPPEQRKQIEEADAASLAANKEKPTAIGNAIEIRNRTDANIEKVNEQTKTMAEPLQKALFDGSTSPQVVAKAVEGLKAERAAQIARELWAGQTTYTGLPWPDSDKPSRPQSAIEQAMAEYRGLGDMVKPTADGKFNYDALTHLQTQYMLSLQKDDPTTAARLSFINQQRVAQADENKPEIVKLYDFVSKTTQDYWDQPYGSKTTYLRDHPQTDAWLNLVGWMPGLHSPQAAVDLYRLAPDRKPVFAK